MIIKSKPLYTKSVVYWRYFNAFIRFKVDLSEFPVLCLLYFLWFSNSSNSKSWTQLRQLRKYWRWLVFIFMFGHAATKRQDDWRPDQNTGSWSGGPSTAAAGSERTSRGHTVQAASFSTPTWQVSAAGVGGIGGGGGVSPSAQPPTKKPDTTSYMSNVIDEPNQQGLAQTGAGPAPNAPSTATIAAALALLVVTKIVT